MEVKDMGLREFVQSVAVLFRVARKPTWEEYSVLARIVLIGIAVLGLISMIVRFVFLAVLG
jgi:protein translocase SEC61 complex gamma subunit